MKRLILGIIVGLAALGTTACASNPAEKTYTLTERDIVQIQRDAILDERERQLKAAEQVRYEEQCGGYRESGSRSERGSVRERERGSARESFNVRERKTEKETCEGEFDYKVSSSKPLSDITEEEVKTSLRHTSRGICGHSADDSFDDEGPLPPLPAWAKSDKDFEPKKEGEIVTAAGARFTWWPKKGS